VTEGKDSIHVSSFVNKLLGNDNEWLSKTPKEMISPKFCVKSPSREADAYLYINLVKRSIALYAAIEQIGNALLLVKKLDVNPSKSIMESRSTDNEFGYLFALKTPNDFRFEHLFRSNIVFNIDTVLPLTQDHDDVYEQILTKGANIYANLDYGRDYSILLENLCATSDLVSNSQKILVALSLGVDMLSKSEFKAAIENLILYGGLSFETISFSYKPRNNEPNKSKLIIAGDLNFKPLLKTELIVKGSLTISQAVSSFTVDSEFLKSQSIDNPFGMKGICIKKIEFIMNFGYENNLPINEPTKMMALSRKIKKSTRLLKGKVGFHSGNPDIEIILEGNILFINGKPCVCCINIDQKISINHLLATIFSENWPKDFPDITFNNGEIYYASTPTTYPEDIIVINKKVYDKGYNIRASIDFFGMANLLINAQINNGITIKITDSENSEINLGFIKIVEYKFIIESSKNNHSIDINGCLKLFDMDPAEFQLDYVNKTKRLEGKININGHLLGKKDPEIVGYWSIKDKLIITNWPSFCKLIWETVEFANIIKEASIGFCTIISDLELNEAFEGHFSIDLKQLETKDESLVSFSITGNYTIKIIGGKENSTEL
ncbi:6044_t:CDS:2, partial [Gigaspora rosea]